MLPTRSIAWWRRVCRENLFAYTDYTLQWASGGTEQLDDDAIVAWVDAWSHYREWDHLTIMGPRTVGKSTQGLIAETWLQWRHPWLQILVISSTPDVTTDQYEWALKICREHPLLRELRPHGIVNSQKKEFNTPGRRSKGRSWRFRSGGTKITGGRAHLVDDDDLEVKETVTTRAQREKMRLTKAEAGNLLFSGHWFAKRVSKGTPWDADSIHRQGMEHPPPLQPVVITTGREWRVEIPAMVKREDGTLEYPFARLQAEELERRRRDLHNEALFRAQYLLDTRRDEEAVPIKKAWIKFARFHPKHLENRTIILDPADGKSTPAELREIRAGERSGDPMGALAVGTKNERLYVYSIFNERTTPRRYVAGVCGMIEEFDPWDMAIEKNKGTGLKTAFEILFEQMGTILPIEAFPTTQNKLSKVLSALVPHMGAGNIIFHESLSTRPELVDETESQLLNLRWYQLPTPDDVLDLLAMAVWRLGQYLCVPTPTEREMPGVGKGAPPLVRETERRRRKRSAESRVAIVSAWD